MNNLINTYRRRIANAALARLQRKTGGNLLIIKLPDNKIETVEVNDHFMNQLLLRFEGLTRVGLREGANKRGNSSRLTQSFHFFMFEPIFSPVNALNQPI